MSASLFGGAFEGKRVLVTGDTGFKGAWLAEWLIGLGAQVSGLALEPDTAPALYDALGLAGRIDHTTGDIRDQAAVESVMQRVAPQVVFHLAAQPLVRRSYSEPIYTFATNVMGTAHVLEAARQQPSVEALVVITTDKVYRNAETGEAFAEDAPLGGHDPYSASKAAAEIVSASYRDSFLRAEGKAMATARAGNVIGGGDWSLDRIVPDCVRALVAGESVGVRNPASLRPWQHVLEPLSGYLWLGALMLQGRAEVADAFNFGPDPGDARTVGELVERFLAAWGSGTWTHPALTGEPHEAGLLRLDIGRAEKALGWRPVWSFETAVDRTARWYRRQALEATDVATLTAEDIAAYVADARRAGLQWAG